MSWFLSGIGAIVGTILLLLVIFAGALAFRYYTADIRGRVDANEQIKSGANRIVQYEQFFNLCASVQTAEVNADNLQKQIDGTENERDRNKLQTSLTGVLAARTTSVNRYNANATKSFTSAQFRDSDLPYQLSAEYEPGGGHTLCAVE